jgi:putative DNA primase/helicase
MRRVTGSLAFGAFARLVMCTARPLTSSAKRRMGRAKSNIGPDGGGFEYHVERVCIDERSGSDPYGQRIVWSDTIEGSALDLLDVVETADQVEKHQRSTPVLCVATDFLRELLADKSMMQKEIRINAEGAGVSWASVLRAKRELRAKATKAGMAGGWWWSPPAPAFPEGAQPDPKMLIQNKVSTFAADELLRLASRVFGSQTPGPTIAGMGDPVIAPVSDAPSPPD